MLKFTLSKTETDYRKGSKLYFSLNLAYYLASYPGVWRKKGTPGNYCLCMHVIIVICII